MSKPEDIPQDVWEAAERHVRAELSGHGRAHKSSHGMKNIIARAIMAAKAEAESERDLLQSILDGRPAINAALPDSYIIWSQAIYSGEAVRVALSARGEG